MKYKKVLKLISGVLIGVALGLSVVITTNNTFAGIMLGIGVGLCYAVVFGAFKKE